MKESIKEKWMNRLLVLSIALPAIVNIVSTILEKIFSKKDWGIVSNIFTIITLVCAFVVLGFDFSKERKYKDIVEELKQTIDYYCGGKRLIADEATITFLKDRLSYKIDIKKKFYDIGEE